MKHYFNLIEIAMSLGILGFGVSAIMSVFPAALQNAENSIGQDYVSNASDLFVSYISSSGKASAADWSTVVIGLPTSKSTVADDRTIINTSSIDADTPNVYASSDAGVYKVIQWNDSSADQVLDEGESIDFEGVVRIWRESITSTINIANTTRTGYDNTTTSPVAISETEGVGIFVELSWPIYKPYDRREKRVFYTEMVNPNSSSL